MYARERVPPALVSDVRTIPKIVRARLANRLSLSLNWIKTTKLANSTQPTFLECVVWFAFCLGRKSWRTVLQFLICTNSSMLGRHTVWSGLCDMVEFTVVKSELSIQSWSITGPNCSQTVIISHDLRTTEPRDPSVSVMVVPLGHLGEDVGSQVLREADAQYLQVKE